LALLCRPGFEADCAEEIKKRSKANPFTSKTFFENGSGLVVFFPQTPGAEEAYRKVSFRDLIFCRQWLVVTRILSAFDKQQLLEKITEALGTCGGEMLEVIFPDNAQSRQFSQLARFLENKLKSASDAVDRTERLPQVCLLDEKNVLVGYRVRNNSSPFPAGIPRLRLPAGAPSRSALKLEEALQVLLDEEERRRYLRPGLRAVDLGAAPGGWSLALARRGLLVTAIDRARLAPLVAENDLIEHLREDGFTYRPPRPVEWLFCDIIDQPTRVAIRVSEWLRRGWCRRALFNLKLPMKKRLEQVKRDLGRLHQAVGKKNLQFRCRQLYHDRREVTCYAFFE